MTLLVPYEAKTTTAAKAPHIGDAASDWFESLVLCRVNKKEMRPPATLVLTLKS
jgi:hypothetical protein